MQARQQFPSSPSPRLFWLTLLGALLQGANASGEPSGAPLLQSTSLIYEGAFRLPRGRTENGTFNYGGTAITLNPETGTLYIVGHDHHSLTAEVSIPPITRSDSIRDLQTARLLQDFADPTEGRRTQINPENKNTQKIGGQLVYNDRLIVSAFSSYDGKGTQRASHFARPLNLATMGEVIGPVAVGSNVHYTSAYMGAIPVEWQEALGGPVLTGNCCRSIIGYQSHGPAFSAFDPDDIGKEDPVDAVSLLYYTKRHQLGPGHSQKNPYFNLTSRVEGIVFPEGTRSILMFGSHGIGEYCYGTGEQCNDPAKPAKGTHAYPYVYQVWAYDAAEAARVKRGKARPYSLEPYAVWQFNLPFEKKSGSHFIGGVAYDAERSLVYISQTRGDNKLPVIHAFRIEIPR